jgi:hypothetical protein
VGRRLPVLNEPAPKKEETGGEEPVPERPPWHWVGFGTVTIFAVWLPLAYAAGAVTRSILASRFGADASADQINLATAAMSEGERMRLSAMLALPPVMGLALAAFAGGLLVGRFGSGTGTREAGMAGAVATIVASTLAWRGFSGSALLTTLAIGLIAVGFAVWGGRLGVARRKRTGG